MRSSAGILSLSSTAKCVACKRSAHILNLASQMRVKQRHSKRAPGGFFFLFFFFFFKEKLRGKAWILEKALKWTSSFRL